ncbi:CinA family nicotinamide mononucleotide deamidase-related protein [Oceanicoccus sagamiensis]|uniref:CinA-like protein n=1 Tax=Oceanicoccus sagamiensis TaxID=716816 RepID=A0A1X9NDN9_9GAMM|nr:CinA family nicotinamide mononucleotide deamidase-related protein [Oceanicoccus sagamiensis]ARN76150.1 damage-inducible protein CinA [Oceanicoccus sagamiensis]
MKIQLLLTGNELMSGHTVDSNSAMIAQQLSAKAYSIARKVTVGDDKADLLAEMQQQSKAADILIVNGGLGPTIDDLTAEILSELTGQAIEENAIAKQHIIDWCERRKLIVNAANLKQAMLPTGVEIIPNPVGSAVGFSINHNDCLIICTPGVPNELRPMMEQTIVELICQRFPNNEQLSTLRFQTFGIGESTLQQMVGDKLTDWPEEVELGFRAGMPLLEIKLTIRKAEHANLQQQCYQRLSALMGHCIVGPESTNLAEAVVQLLQQQHAQLSTAESCTGGLIASAITEIAGASAVFEAGYVTYSNDMKQDMLGVDSATLEQHGAVSEPVVIAMAHGAMERSGAGYGIAVSGVAGPDGGSDDKPVGTVWMAWGSKAQLHTRKLVLKASRKGFQQMVTAITLDLTRRELLGIEAEPRYLSRYSQ